MESYLLLQLLINLPSIVLNLQGGVGKRTVSLLIAEASFDAEVKNWSSKVILRLKQAQ